MKARRRPLVVLLLLAAVAAAAAAAPVSLKLGSIAPQGSPWDQSLKRIGEEWSRLSAGEVSLRVYAGGAAGAESDILRKVRIGQLQGALLTMSGLQSIWNGMKALSFPLFIRDDVELQHVLDALRPELEQELEARGFTVLFWTPGGWMYFFSRQPVVTPDDLRRQKIWVTGDPDEVQAWRGLGFQVVPLAATEVTTALASGMIDAVATSPLVAASNQWFATARNMCGLKLSPLYGAMVVSTRSLEAIEPDLRQRLLEAARLEAARLSVKVMVADRDAVVVMERYGMHIVEVPEPARAQWEAVVQQGFGMLIGTAYDAKAYEAARKVLEEWRAGHAGP